MKMFSVIDKAKALLCIIVSTGQRSAFGYVTEGHYFSVIKKVPEECTSLNPADPSMEGWHGTAPGTG